MNMKKIICIVLLWLCVGCSATTDVITAPKPEYQIVEAKEENVLESKIICYANWFHEEETVTELEAKDFYEKFPRFTAFPENWQLDNATFVNVIFQDQLGESYGLSYLDGEKQLTISIRSLNEPEVDALIKEKPNLLTQANTVWKWSTDEGMHASFFKNGYYYTMLGRGIHDSEILTILDVLLR